MVKLPATPSRTAAEFRFRDPVKQGLWEAITSLGPAGMAALEAEISRQLAEGIARAEARRPGALALALVAAVDAQPAPRVYDIPQAVTGGKDLLREHMKAEGVRYDNGRIAALVWPRLRDEVLVQATLYFARIAARERFVRTPSSHSDRAHRIVEMLWSMLRVVDRAELEPTGYFDGSVYDVRPGFQG